MKQRGIVMMTINNNLFYWGTNPERHDYDENDNVYLADKT